MFDKKTRFYVSRKDWLIWIVALYLAASVVGRVAVAVVNGLAAPDRIWLQVVLPGGATALFLLMILLDGQEHFYKTAIPVWLMGLYYAIRPHTFLGSRLVFGLYLTSLLFFCISYMVISAGKGGHPWLLLGVFGIPLAVLLYFLRKCWASGLLLPNGIVLIPDILAFFGCLLLVFSIRPHPLGTYHPTWGDRPDGRRLRTLNPMDRISPYIMPNRSGATNYFCDAFEITNVDHYIRQKRKDGMTGFGLIHVFLAAYCRCMAKYPALNRFLAGQRIYSRDGDIQFCMVIKKEMRSDAPETIIKVHLTPGDTADQVYQKVNAAVDAAKDTPLDSAFDQVAYGLTLIPGVFLKFGIWCVKTLDYFGLLPKFLLEVSPFHASVFFTSMGSLGIPPVYHHLYDLGNLPLFCAFGCKRRALELQEDGTLVQKKYVDFRISTDERIVDGFYYAAFFKHYRRLLLHPEVLDQPPLEVARDID